MSDFLQLHVNYRMADQSKDTLAKKEVVVWGVCNHMIRRLLSNLFEMVGDKMS
ncbi:hypothetical protein [Marinoscillum luteum]|uniref:Uncharacterized protein n=1 Tax=Marinoscillum luteum TaxID=861051 RepID=A0ABW7N6D8_9BACT